MVLSDHILEGLGPLFPGQHLILHDRIRLE
jgi:hypothetical protein